MLKLLGATVELCVSVVLMGALALVVFNHALVVFAQDDEFRGVCIVPKAEANLDRIFFFIDMPSGTLGNFAAVLTASLIHRTALWCSF